MSTFPTPRLSLALPGIQLLGRAAAEASAMALVTPPPLPERPDETRGHRA
jgi:hypothetical protein